MKKIILFIIFNLLFITHSNAKDLIKALNQAYNSNLKLNAERENIKIAKENVNEALSDFLPSITISGYVSEEETTKLTKRNGKEIQGTDLDPSQRSILIEQKLFQGLGGVSNFKKNNLGLELSEYKLKKIEQEILFSAIEAYTGLVLSYKKVSINISNVNLIERQVETDKNRLEQGEISLTDLAQSEASLAGAKAKLIDAENKLIISKLNYQKTIGSINNYQNLFKMGSFNYELPRSLAIANQISKKENPNLNIAILELEQSEQDIQIAKSELLPSAKLSFEVKETQDLSSTIDEKDQEILKAEASWPFSLGGKNTAALRKSKSLKYQKELLLEDAIKSNEVSVFQNGPHQFELNGVYPNPFNPVTEINFSIPKAGYITLVAFNTNGQLVDVIFDGYQEVGLHSYSWYAGNLPSVVYYIKLSDGRNQHLEKVLLLK